MIEKLGLGHDPVGMKMQMGENVKGAGARRQFDAIQTCGARIGETIEMQRVGYLFAWSTKRCTLHPVLSNRASGRSARAEPEKTPHRDAGGVS